MRELFDILDQFTPSKPVFFLHLSGSYVYAHINEDVQPELPPHDKADVIFDLVRRHYTEKFVTKTAEFHVLRDAIIDNCQSEMRDTITKFIRHNVKAKNPSQTKLFRFYNRSNLLFTQNILIDMYKYLRSFSDDEGRINIGQAEGQKHASNMLALLTAIMEKHE